MGNRISDRRAVRAICEEVFEEFHPHLRIQDDLTEFNVTVEVEHDGERGPFREKDFIAFIDYDAKESVARERLLELRQSLASWFISNPSWKGPRLFASTH